MPYRSPFDFRDRLHRRALAPARAAVFGAVCAAVLLTAGCSAPAEDRDGAGSDASPERRFLSLGTAPPGGAFFVVGGALAEVLDTFGPEGWQVTNEATKGSQENIRRIESGELDLALANSAITYFAVRGAGEWEKAFDVRAVMTLAPNVALFLSPRGSSVESLADLRGRRVVVGPAGAGFEYFLRPVLAAHELTYDDFTPLNATQAGAVDMLADGSAGAAFLGGAVPTSSITQATSSQVMNFLPYAEAAKEQLLAEYPFFDRATIPAGTYRGQDAAYEGLNVGSMHLILAASASEAFAYEVTKTLWEQREAVVQRHPAGRAINPKVAVRNTGTQFHPGAIRFYRELGIWPTEAETESPGQEAGTVDE